MKPKGASKILVQVLAVLLAIAYLIPVYMTVVTSLKAPEEINLMTAWELPSKPNWESYSTAFKQFAPYLKNSFILAISATLISAVMGSLNGYVLCKYPIPGTNIIMPLIVFGMFIPYQSILVPLFQFMQKTKLVRGATRLDTSACSLWSSHYYPAF